MLPFLAGRGDSPHPTPFIPALGQIQPHIQWKSGTFPWGESVRVPEVNHSHLSNTDVNNESICISTPPYTFIRRIQNKETKISSLILN